MKGGPISRTQASTTHPNRNRRIGRTRRRRFENNNNNNNTRVIELKKGKEAQRLPMLGAAGFSSLRLLLRMDSRWRVRRKWAVAVCNGICDGDGAAAAARSAARRRPRQWRRK